jgi:hypothetical protein
MLDTTARHTSIDQGHPPLAIAFPALRLHTHCPKREWEFGLEWE